MEQRERYAWKLGGPSEVNPACPVSHMRGNRTSRMARGAGFAQIKKALPSQPQLITLEEPAPVNRQQSQFPKFSRTFSFSFTHHLPPPSLPPPPPLLVINLFSRLLSRLVALLSSRLE